MIKLFLDSGAHSLYNKHARRKADKSFFDSAEFREYVRDYGTFIKRVKKSLFLYVNVDTIFDPERTWRTQRIMEQEHGVSPLPVVHFGTERKWVERYAAKYDYIGVGGLGQEVSANTYVQWADMVFKVLDGKKTHGFAMTAPRLMRRYPWYSVDSATWVKVASYGGIILPVKNDIMIIDMSSVKKEQGVRHLTRLSPMERDYLKDIVEGHGHTIEQLEECYKARTKLNGKVMIEVAKKFGVDILFLAGAGTHAESERYTDELPGKGQHSGTLVTYYTTGDRKRVEAQHGKNTAG